MANTCIVCYFCFWLFNLSYLSFLFVPVFYDHVAIYVVWFARQGACNLRHFWLFLTYTFFIRNWFALCHPISARSAYLCFFLKSLFRLICFFFMISIGTCSRVKYCVFLFCLIRWGLSFTSYFSAMYCCLVTSLVFRRLALRYCKKKSFLYIEVFSVLFKLSEVSLPFTCTLFGFLFINKPFSVFYNHSELNPMFKDKLTHVEDVT